jgi:hypothetical protein
MNCHDISIPKDELSAFCRRNHIRRLALFGSVLREDFRPESDIDVLVEFEPGTHLGLRFFELESQLGEFFGRRVDLNTPGFLGKSFRDKVLSDAEILYDAAK